VATTPPGRSTVCCPLCSHFSHPFPEQDLQGAVTRPVSPHLSQPAQLHAGQVTFGWNMACPPAKIPGGRGTSCSSDRAVTLFPDPHRAFDFIPHESPDRSSPIWNNRANRR
jgi:hypothetical protein